MRVLYVALALSGVIVACSATTCYVCEGVVDSDCADKFKASADLEQDCSASNSFLVEDGGCTKVKEQAEVLGATVTTVTRSCGKSYADNSNCAQKDRIRCGSASTLYDSWYCSCEGDKCNGGSQLAFSSALMIAALAKYLL